MIKLFYKIGIPLIALVLLTLPAVPATAQEQEKITFTNEEKTLTIYPMPVINVAHIKLSPALRTDVSSLEIINLIGRKITEQTIIGKNTTDISFTNLNELPEGIYMVIARDKYGKIIQSAKMILNK